MKYLINTFLLLMCAGTLSAQQSSQTLRIQVSVDELAAGPNNASAGLVLDMPDSEKELSKPPASFAVQILQNNAAGFYPLILGSFGIAPKLSFTYYGVFWTNSAFGTLETGSDLWFEYGFGLGFKAAQEKLFLNPSLGFTNGKFLSGGGSNVVGDGIVPSLFALYNQGIFETEFYLSYYKSLRSGGPVTRDFILNWVLPGIRINDHVALGVHYEQFVNTRVTDGDPSSVYQWLGGYLRLTAGKGYSLRISAGKNMQEDSPFSSEFYKISVFLPLLQ